MRNQSTIFMRKSLTTIALGLALLGAALFLVAAAPPDRVSMRGHVPAVVSHLQAKGRLAETNELYLAIGLPLRNQEALSNLLQQIYDQASPNYHHYLTPEEFTAQFGPTEQEYQAVVDFARQNGLAVAGTHPNRMVLDVRGKAADVEKAFKINLHMYRHPTENRDFFAPDTEPSIESGLRVLDITGLDNYRRPHTKYRLKPAVPQKAGAKADTGSGPSGNYMGDDFRNAYAPGAPQTGVGQTVALVQFDGYFASNIALYESLIGRPNVPLQNVLLDGFNGLPTGNGGEIEVSLDIEMAISMAPGLAQVVLYEGNPNNFIPNDVLNRIATDNTARQISCSWGWPGGPSATTDQIFQQMAVQGQTFFDASGDSDAFTAGANSVNGVDNPNLPNEPSSNPYITQVGGTTLTMAGAGAIYASETVWNAGLQPDGTYAGSSGGISSFYSIPSWQTGINMAAALGSTSFRNVPDVAMTADNVLVVADAGVGYFDVGGTSCAAPLWAGFIALVNQKAAGSGQAAVGFINPALYAIATSPAYYQSFNDVTAGNNYWSASPSMFPAVSGYDLCTGLGTPKGTNFINTLLNVSETLGTVFNISPPQPPYGTNLANLNGGNPNGSWNLFVQDDVYLFAGSISSGWMLALTTANPVGAAADNQVLVTASSGNIALGTNVTFTITVTNYGPTISTNVFVTGTLQSGFMLISSNATQGPVSIRGTLLDWNVGTLAVNAGAQLAVTVKPAANGNFVDSATVNSLATPDPNPDDNSASATVVVGPGVPPQLLATLVNTNRTFQFTVTNTPGQLTIVQASTNLVTWVPIYTNATGGIYTFTDTNATGYPWRFYRVIAP